MDVLTVFSLVVIVVPLILALLLGFAPLYSSFHRWAEANRSKVFLSIFIASWLLSWVAFSALLANFYYTISDFYFDSIFSSISGVTRDVVHSSAGSILVELWLREMIGWLTPSTCFASSVLTCQLADAAQALGNFGIAPVLIAIVPAAISFFIARWILLRDARSKADQAAA